jgi:hypothetical protein
MQLREILQIEDSPLARQLHHVVAVVDRLHRFPNLPHIPLVLTKSRRESGAYDYRMRPSRPISIAVSVYGNSPSVTLLHEIGHLLDHLALNPIKCGFGSEHDPLFEPLRVYWSRSLLIRRMNALHARKSAVAPGTRATIRYQLGIPEIWARTYLQWVIAKSDDLLLQVCFHSDTGGVKALAGPVPHYYWDHQELDDIIVLVDRLFSEAGLL